MKPLCIRALCQLLGIQHLIQYGACSPGFMGGSDRCTQAQLPPVQGSLGGTVQASMEEADGPLPWESGKDKLDFFCAEGDKRYSRQTEGLSEPGRKEGTGWHLSL